MAQDANEVESLARARLRSLRQARGWSLDDLAERSNVSASTISRLETGGRRLTLDTATPRSLSTARSRDSAALSNASARIASTAMAQAQTIIPCVEIMRPDLKPTACGVNSGEAMALRRWARAAMASLPTHRSHA